MEFKGLFGYQLDAVKQLKSGSILCGDVGTGKTLTGLYFYKERYPDRQLYVITTAKKRDTGDWEDEARLLGIDELVVDSWNNIKKYQDLRNAFFIFDEQRVVGWGAWSKAFVKLARTNKWILLTGTPGDTWMDYIPVFVANNYYENKTQFINSHVEYDPYVKYPKVKRYHQQGLLQKYRRQTLVRMENKRHTIRHRHFIECMYDDDLYKDAFANKWNPFENEPVQHAGALAQVLRKVTGTSDGRVHEAVWQLNHVDKAIVFYNYNYELDILRSICEFIHKPYAEWNGQKHEELPDTDEWLYLVQYNAGAEGWNCTTTDTILFYSPNYSYKMTEQAEGRIDRINTPFTDLHYIYLTSKAPIDEAVLRSIRNKKNFNENAWLERSWTHA